MDNVFTNPSVNNDGEEPLENVEIIENRLKKTLEEWFAQVMNIYNTKENLIQYMDSPDNILILSNFTFEPIVEGNNLKPLSFGDIFLKLFFPSKWFAYLEMNTNQDRNNNIRYKNGYIIKNCPLPIPEHVTINQFMKYCPTRKIYPSGHLKKLEIYNERSSECNSNLKPKTCFCIYIREFHSLV